MMHGKSSEAGLSPAQQQLRERLLDGRARARAADPIPRLPPGSQVPLSSAQARIWFVCRMYPESAEYNVLGPPLGLISDASRECVEAALRTVMDRHDALRLQIVEVDGAPLQAPLGGLAPPLAWHDLRGLPAADAALRAAELGHRAARAAFALEEAPLFRVVAVRLTQRDLRLFVVAHHIIVDGWSMDLVYDELHTLLQGGALGPTPAVRYLDYVAWERGRVDERRLAQQLDYWRHKLAGPLPLLDVPKDRPWITARGRGGHAVACAIPRAVVAKARALAAAEGTTLFVTLLAAYQVLLLRLGGQRDVIVGAPLAGRDHPAAEAVVGSFARIVALRTDLGGRPSFREVLRRVHATTVEARDHQAVPFERIVADLKLPRGPSCSPIFQTVFGLHTASGDRAYDSETSKWELSLSLIEAAQEVSGYLEYASDLFDQATIARYAELYTTLLAAAVAAPDRAVGEHALLSAAAQARILYGLRTPVRLEVPYATLAAPFEIQVRRTPDAIALAGDDGTLTYRALNERANQLAHLLRAHGVAPGGWVAVCMERGFALVTALYAIAKAGAAYVPLDPRSPGDRIRFQLEDTQSRWVITHPAAKPSVPDGPWQTICLEDVAAQLAGRPTEDVPCPGPASQLAYLMYTSGSAGRPKAVAFPVEAALSSVFWLQRCFPVMTGDRHLCKTPYSFDVSLWELFWPLYFGGVLVVCRPEGHLDPAYLAALIEQHDVTSVCFVPAMLQAFLDELAPGRCRSLRWVHCGGEALTPRLRDACHARLGATLVNGYGPTETHAVTLMEIAPAPGCPRVPLGRPIAAYRLYVLDAELQPQPIGVAGELYIGGEVGLAHGYHRRPGLTAERFLPDPFGPAGARMYRTGDLCRYDDAGVLQHLGRCDAQVKLLGVRIEPAEIEAVLCEHPAVRAAVVLAIGGEGGERLVGFVVPAGPALIDARDVLQHAGRLLPRHMIPAALVGLDRIPTTANGKLDREALVARWRAVEATEAAEVVAPATGLERRLQRIFAQVLGVADVGVTANFFDLGGHSLLIFKLLSACEQELGIRRTVADVFAAPTVRELAARIDAAARPASTSLVPLAPQPGKPILVFVHAAGGSALPFVEVAGRLGPDFSIFALQAAGLDGDGPVAASIEDLAASYLPLVDAIRGVSPVILAGWSMGGCVALEMARRWQQQGVAIAALLLIDAWMPPAGLDALDAPDAWRRTLLGIDFLAHERRSVPVRTDGEPGLFARLERVLDANRRAFVAYRPAWFDGEIDYLRATEELPGDGPAFPAACLSADRGWARHVRRVTVHPVAGDHFTLIAKPHAASLADTIRAIALARLSFSEV